MRQGHCRRPKARRIGDRKIDLVLGLHSAFKRDAIGFGNRVAYAVLDKIEPLLFFERGLQIRGAADEPGLPLLADAALENGFYKYRAVLLDEALDLFLAGVGAEYFGRRKSCELQ